MWSVQARPGRAALPAIRTGQHAGGGADDRIKRRKRTTGFNYIYPRSPLGMWLVPGGGRGMKYDMLNPNAVLIYGPPPQTELPDAPGIPFLDQFAQQWNPPNFAQQLIEMQKKEIDRLEKEVAELKKQLKKRKRKVEP